MHRFTDCDVTDSGLMELCHPDDSSVNVDGVYVTALNTDTGSLGTVFLSKEDLLYLLKLIEETN